MFFYLKGKIVRKIDNILVLDINGVGFKIYTSAFTLANIKVDSEVIIYTYTYVREDTLDIYGFSTEEELSFFIKLISISGVGPRLALAILSTISTQDIIVAVLSDDAKKISRSPGVGPKLAQRIILELKDKMKDSELQQMVTIQSTFSSQKAEAVSALVGLGYKEEEAQHAVSTVGECNSLEEVIKKSLASLIG